MGDAASGCPTIQGRVSRGAGVDANSTGRTVGLGPGIQFGGRGTWFCVNSYIETDVRNRPSGIKVTFRISKTLPTAEPQP